MLTCFVCKEAFRISNHLISHLRVEHGYYPGQKFKLYYINSLKHFHVCNNYSFDIMHDLLEGVAQYEVKLLFGYLIQTYIFEQDLFS